MLALFVPHSSGRAHTRILWYVIDTVVIGSDIAEEGDIGRGVVCCIHHANGVDKVERFATSRILEAGGLGIDTQLCEAYGGHDSRYKMSRGSHLRDLTACRLVENAPRR